MTLDEHGVGLTIRFLEVSRTQMKSVIVVCAMLFGLGTATGEGFSEKCSNHGTLQEEQCLCDNPFPNVGESGWAGDICNIPVHGVVLNSADVANQCKGKERCGVLEKEGDEVCFYSSLDWNAPWKYLLVQFIQPTDGSSDPDLYGFFSDSRQQFDYPDGHHHSPAFVELSSTATAVTALKINKPVHDASSSRSVFDGVHMCVRNLQVHLKKGGSHSTEATFKLRASTTACPGRYTLDGQLTICSSKPSDIGKVGAHADKCNSNGTCDCRNPYRVPSDITVFPDTGFDDCSALLVDTSTGTEKQPDKGIFRFHRSYEQPVGSAYMFELNVTEEATQLRVLAEVEDEKGEEVVLLLKYGAPPGQGYGQYDARSEFHDYSTGMNDRFVSVAKGIDDEFRTGTWWAGLFARHAGNAVSAVRYDLTIEVNRCLSGCSNRGKCVIDESGEYVCQCDEGAFLDDCSGSHNLLQFNEAKSDGPIMGTTSYWLLNADTMKLVDSIGDFKVVVHVDKSTYPDTLEGQEVLFQVGSDTDFPTLDHNIRREKLNSEGDTEIAICDSQIPKDSNLIIGVASLNPYYELSYTIQVMTSMGCREGNLKPMHKPENHGTCWNECKCDNKVCKYDSACTHFTCDKSYAQHNSFGWRKNPSASECVMDQCRKDHWQDTADHVCLEVCHCPDDGGACTFHAGCHAAYFSCKPGYAQDPASNPPTCDKDGSKSVDRHLAPRRQHTAIASQGHVVLWCLLTAIMTVLITGFAMHQMQMNDMQIRDVLSGVWKKRPVSDGNYMELQSGDYDC